ncbi:MAG: pilB1 [Parcubacteria group bacterium]|nr:pilB1 [Parcubacteria group bacterium]
MHAEFDTDREDEKLAHARAEEEEDLVRIMSEKYDVPYTDLSFVPINMDALRIIPEADARAAEAVAFDKNGKHLSVALRELTNDAYARLEEQLKTQGYTVEKFLVSNQSIQRAFVRYSELSRAVETDEGVFSITSDHEEAVNKASSSLPSLREHLTELVSSKNPASLSSLLETVLAAAITMKASDVHLEPEELGNRMRFRLDGVLTDIFSFDAHSYKLIDSRLKLLAGLKLNITDRAQDGRFTIAVKAKELEVRVSVIPGSYGESFVLRLLDPETTKHSFKELGIHSKLLARLEEELRRPNGMLLNTGPTGSGKTTTLYAFLREIHTPAIKIVTIEDPVEYHLEGIVQTQTNGDDYTFASGLRSVLRQDPDVIMVGEIRDAEVADVAIQAALTGHFVFSTLHTNDASGTFPRLADLGVDSKSFASAISVAMAQRLVRTLNPDKKKKRPTTDGEKKLIERVFATQTDKSLVPTSYDEIWTTDGDIENEDTGYKGRTGVYEAIFMDPELGAFLRENPSSGEIAKHVERQGFLTMAQDGILKALGGETSLEEVLRVVDVPRE